MPEETPLSDEVVYDARPILRVDGQEEELVTELLLRLDVRMQEGGLTSVEARFSNVASDEEDAADFAFEDEEILALGGRLTVDLGDVTDPTEVFSGVITGIEAEFPDRAPPELVVYAEDDLQLARMARRTKVHDNLTLSDLANDVAQAAGMHADVQGFSDDLGTHAQLNESDLAFLRRLLVRYDGDLQVVDGTLEVRSREDTDRGDVTAIHRSQLRSVRFFADLAHQVTAVSTSGFDISSGRAVDHTADSRSPGPGEGRLGAGILEDSIGTRSEHIGHLAVASREEAQALTEAAFDQRARRFVCAEGTLAGNPAVRVGTTLELSGVGRRFSNQYYVTAAHHRYDLESGYQTDFRAECAFLGGP